MALLPDWEQQVLGFLNLYDMSLFMEQSNSLDGNVYVVSDGGVREGKGTFGWVIATATEVICEGRGTVRGSPITSYRAEAYGRLSVLWFLYRWCEFHKFKSIGRVQQFSDNKALVQRTRFEHQYDSANSAVVADYDLLVSIAKAQNLLRQHIPRLAQPAHVMGHSDTKKRDEPLLPQEELNIRADEIATEAFDLIDNELWQGEVFLPACKAFLLADGVVVASNEKRLLRWRWANFRLQDYFSRRYKWEADQLDMVNWAAYGRAGASKAGGTFRTKWLIGWLPTGSRLSKYGSLATTCLLCGEEETNEHLFLCRHQQQQNEAMLMKLEEKMKELKTVPRIIDGIIEGLGNWLRGNQQEHSMGKCHQYGPCISQQQLIGWDKVLKGLLGNEWACHQEWESDLETSGDRWCGRLAMWLQEQARQRWEQRNERVHRQEQRDNESWATREALAQLRDLYAMQDRVSAQDRRIFHIPLAEREQHSIRLIQAWVRRMKPAILHAVSSEDQRQREQNRDIRDLLQPVPTEPMESDEDDPSETSISTDSVSQTDQAINTDTTDEQHEEPRRRRSPASSTDDAKATNEETAEAEEDAASHRADAVAPNKHSTCTDDAASTMVAGLVDTAEEIHQEEVDPRRLTVPQAAVKAGKRRGMLHRTTKQVQAAGARVQATVAKMHAAGKRVGRVTIAKISKALAGQEDLRSKWRLRKEDERHRAMDFSGDRHVPTNEGAVAEGAAVEGTTGASRSVGGESCP